MKNIIIITLAILSLAGCKNHKCKSKEVRSKYFPISMEKEKYNKANSAETSSDSGKQVPIGESPELPSSWLPW